MVEEGTAAHKLSSDLLRQAATSLGTHAVLKSYQGQAVLLYILNNVNNAVIMDFLLYFPGFFE